MTQIPIKRAIERVPGGMMVVPLLCGALFATFGAGTAKFFGSFTGALFTVKIALGILLGVMSGRLLGEAPVGAGMFAGISTLAIVASMNDTNGGLYMALMGQYGHPRDVGAYTVMSL